jgi:hypothetical protein
MMRNAATTLCTGHHEALCRVNVTSESAATTLWHGTPTGKLILGLVVAAQHQFSRGISALSRAVMIVSGQEYECRHEVAGRRYTAPATP